jgi:hypothetical protein
MSNPKPEQWRDWLEHPCSKALLGYADVEMSRIEKQWPTANELSFRTFQSEYQLLGRILSFVSASSRVDNHYLRTAAGEPDKLPTNAGVSDA